MPLSDVALRSAKPTDSIQKLSDGGGLQLWIMPNGSKLWRLAYRFDGKQKKLSVGRYPSVGLSEARAKREEAKSLLAMGRDPSIQKQTDKALAIEVQGQTFQKIASEVLAKKRNEGKASNTLGKIEWLHRLANAALGNRPISEITAPEVLSALRKVEGKGRLETAKRLRATIGEVFRFAIATARATNDPTFALRGALTAPTVKHRAAITEPKELGALLRAIEAFEGQPTTVAALKLMAILFPRPGELRLAEWREFDLANALWTIPASRAKMRREHRVPLPRQALAIPVHSQQRVLTPCPQVRAGPSRSVRQAATQNSPIAANNHRQPRDLLASRRFSSKNSIQNQLLDSILRFPQAHHFSPRSRPRSTVSV
jgi:integrase